MSRPRSNVVASTTVVTPASRASIERLRGAVHERGAAAEQRRPSADDPRRRACDVLVGEDEPQRLCRDRPGDRCDVCHTASCQGRASASTIEPSSRRSGTAMCPQVRRPVFRAERGAPDPAPGKEARCATATRRREELREALCRDTRRQHDPRAVDGARDVAAHRFDARRGRRRRGSGPRPCRCRRRPRAAPPRPPGPPPRGERRRSGRGRCLRRWRPSPSRGRA